MFYECCNESNGNKRSPHSWGVLVDESVKRDLVDNGWHINLCDNQEGQCGGASHFVVMRGLESSLNRIIATMNKFN